MDIHKFLLVLSFINSTFSILFDGPRYSGNGESPQYWRDHAKSTMQRIMRQTTNTGVAKNVILFLGDGMSTPTVTAGRILKGQLAGNTGEETVVSFEQFPVSGFSKTYAQDAQVTDSASSATAFLCGVKANIGTVGVDARVTYQNCPSQKGAELTSILDWSLAAGKSVGIVTTTRVTHATPAGAYASAADRWWESDYNLREANVTGGCRDIATQLIEDYPNVQVILGGGRRNFMRYDQRDPEDGPNAQFARRDGRDLIQEWQSKQHILGKTSHYVWNKAQFDNVVPDTTDSLMGLFENSDMHFEIDRTNPNIEKAGEPSLAEMTDKAIKILGKNPKGFFLLVEGGRIDYGHHLGQAKLALHDFLAFESAVASGDQLTNEQDSLIIVTADHSHTLTIAGYPQRGNDIFGLSHIRGNDTLGTDGKPYTTLLYADGPGYAVANGSRLDPSHDDTTSRDYHQQAAVPMTLETHGGDDVGIWARGPMAHLLSGTHEISDIAHVMAFSSCVGDYLNDCSRS